jgi:hypothetical protein
MILCVVKVLSAFVFYHVPNPDEIGNKTNDDENDVCRSPHCRKKLEDKFENVLDAVEK